MLTAIVVGAVVYGFIAGYAARNYRLAEIPAFWSGLIGLFWPLVFTCEIADKLFD